MLFDARQKDGWLEATPQNVLLVLEKILPNIPAPKFSFDILQVVGYKRYNYNTRQKDLLDSIVVYEPVRLAHELNPEMLRFVLNFQDGKWTIVSQEYFDEVYK